VTKHFLIQKTAPLLAFSLFLSTGPAAIAGDTTVQRIVTDEKLGHLFTVTASGPVEHSGARRQIDCRTSFYLRDDDSHRRSCRVLTDTHRACHKQDLAITVQSGAGKQIAFEISPGTKTRSYFRSRPESSDGFVNSFTTIIEITPNSKTPGRQDCYTRWRGYDFRIRVK